MGFDADVLVEIQLHELESVVDKISIMQSTRTHNKVEQLLPSHELSHGDWASFNTFATILQQSTRI